MEKKLAVLPYLDINDTGGGMITSLRRQLKNLSALGWSGVIISELSDPSHEGIAKLHNFDIVYAHPATERWVPLKKPWRLPAFWGKAVARNTLLAKAVRERGIRLVYIAGPPNFPVTGTPNMLMHWMLQKKASGFKAVIGVRGAGSSWIPNPAMARIFLAEEVSQISSADRFTCVDHFILNDHYPARLRDKGEIITNTVETELFHSIDEPEDPLRVLFVGHLTAERGIWEFLRAAEILREKPYKFAIIGKGALEPQVRDFIRENGLHAELLGAVDYSKMAPEYAKAAVVVNPTPMEGIGNITLEAMACAKCVIRTKSKYREYVIDHGKNGLLFARGDPADLAKQIGFAMENPEKRKAMGQEALALVKRDYTEEAEAKKYDALFSSLL